MNEADQWIIGAGIVNALVVIGLVLIFRSWPKKTSKRK